MSQNERISLDIRLAGIKILALYSDIGIISPLSLSPSPQRNKKSEVAGDGETQIGLRADTKRATSSQNKRRYCVCVSLSFLSFFLFFFFLVNAFSDQFQSRSPCALSPCIIPP